MMFYGQWRLTDHKAAGGENLMSACFSALADVQRQSSPASMRSMDIRVQRPVRVVASVHCAFCIRNRSPCFLLAALKVPTPVD